MHTTSEWESWDLNPLRPTPEFRYLTTTPTAFSTMRPEAVKHQSLGSFVDAEVCGTALDASQHRAQAHGNCKWALHTC